MAERKWPIVYCACGCETPVNRSNDGTPRKYRQECRTRAFREEAAARKHKPCWECGITKPMEEFHRNRLLPDGRHRVCKDCKNQKERERSRSENSRAIRAERIEGYKARTSSPDYRGPDTKVCSICPEEKPRAEFSCDKMNKDGLRGECNECRRAEKRAIRKRNHEAELERERRYRRNHPAQFRAYDHARRAGQGAGAFTAEQWVAMVEFYEDTCLRCGDRGGMSVDHVVPRSKGGGNDVMNIQPLCSPCNSSKHIKATDYRDPHLHAQLLTAMEFESLL